MKECLYDSQGYEIRIEVTRTYNPSRDGQSVDTRDLGILLCYLGAAMPEYEHVTYEKDPYVLSRLEFPLTVHWKLPGRSMFREHLPLQAGLILPDLTYPSAARLQPKSDATAPSKAYCPEPRPSNTRATPSSM